MAYDERGQAEKLKADEKLKTVEAERTIFPNPHLDAVGSGITFTIYTGIPTGKPPLGGTELIFGGGGGGGFVAPDTSTQVTFAPKGATPKLPPPVYMAVCTQAHALESPGVDGNGTWSSGVFDDCQTAFAVALGHEHAVDRVEQIIGPVGVAIDHC